MLVQKQQVGHWGRLRTMRRGLWAPGQSMCRHHVDIQWQDVWSGSHEGLPSFAFLSHLAQNWICQFLSMAPPRQSQWSFFCMWHDKLWVMLCTFVSCVRQNIMIIHNWWHGKLVQSHFSSSWNPPNSPDMWKYINNVTRSCYAMLCNFICHEERMSISCQRFRCMYINLLNMAGKTLSLSRLYHARLSGNIMHEFCHAV